MPRRLYLATLLLWTGRVAGAEAPPTPVELPWTLQIQWQAEPSDKAAASACERLGSSVVAGRGPFGLGVFSRFACGGNGEPQKPTDWILEVRTSESDRLKLVLKYSGGAATVEAFDFAKVELEGGPFRSRDLNTKDAALILAAIVLDLLPASGAVTLNPATEGQVSVSGQSYKRGEALPKITLYEMSFDDALKLWIPTRCASATLIRSATRRWSYQLGKDAVCPGGKRLWIAPPDGPRLRTSELAGQLAAAVGHRRALRLGADNRPGFLSPKALGYAGARVGKQVLAGGPTLESLVYYGAMVDWRAPPLAGLRLYVEGVPLAEKAQDDTVKRFGWSRAQLAFAIGLGDLPLIDRIEIAPRLGFMSLVAEIVRDPEAAADPERFGVRRQPAFGLLGQMEKSFGRTTIRPWVGADVALPVAKSVANSKITAVDGGLDLFFTPDWGKSLLGEDRSLSLMAFGFGESLVITKVAKDSEAEASGLSYSLAFVGLGAVISW